MKIWIDADACPKGALEAARRAAQQYSLCLQTVSSYRHEFADPAHITVDASPEATDMAIIAKMSPGDIVVTQDYGLAALVLARAGYPLSPKGLIYSAENIDSLLAQRAAAIRTRRGKSKHHVRGPAPRTHEDDIHFAAALEQVIRPFL